jgi:hypothetical protein
LRSILALAALAVAAPLHAQEIAVESAVFLEHVGEHGLRVEPATRFVSGDTVVTVMSWQAPVRSRSSIVSAVPPHLVLESVSRDGLEVSTDNARTWRRIEDARDLPLGVTHLRWPARGDGRLTYRAIVR